MRMLTLILEILSFSFALWLGCYLPARNSAKAVLRLTGLGLVAYAFSLAGNLLSEYAPTSRLMVGFGVVHPGLLFLPTLCWVGATIHLLPETTPLATLLGIPAPLVLGGTGFVLGCYGVALFFLAAQQRINPKLALAVILLDVIWVIDSIVLLLSGRLPLTTAGIWIIAILALIVAGFAEVQYLGLRRMRRDKAAE